MCVCVAAPLWSLYFVIAAVIGALVAACQCWYTHIYIFTYIYIYIFALIHARTYSFCCLMSVHKLTHTYIHIYTHIYMSIYVCIFSAELLFWISLNMRVCVWVCQCCSSGPVPRNIRRMSWWTLYRALCPSSDRYEHTHTHAHTRTHTHTHAYMHVWREGKRETNTHESSICARVLYIDDYIYIYIIYTICLLRDLTRGNTHESSHTHTFESLTWT